MIYQILLRIKIKKINNMASEENKHNFKVIRWRHYQFGQHNLMKMTTSSTKI